MQEGDNMRIVRVRNVRLNEEFELVEPIEVPDEIMTSNETEISYYVLNEINKRWMKCKEESHARRRKNKKIRI